MIGSFNLPPGAQVIRKSSYLEFPNVGNEKNIYIDMTRQVIYRWDKEDRVYKKDSQDLYEITSINGGNANG